MVFTGKEEDDNFTEVALDGSRESNRPFPQIYGGLSVLCRTIQSAFAYLNTPSVENIKNFDDLKTSEGERELGLSFLSLAKLRNQNFDIKVCKF